MHEEASSKMARVNILGIGTMGSQISALLAVLGYHVTAWNRGDSTTRQKQCDRARRQLARKIKDKEGVIQCVNDLQSMQQAMTLEVLEEDLQTKRSIIGQLPYDPATDGLFSNTSSYRPSEIHPAAGGLHFFNPIHALHLVEYLPPAKSSAAGQHLLQALTKSAFTLVKVKDNRGYIGNFMLFSEIAATLRLIDEFGYTIEAINEVNNCIGRNSSIFSIIDLIGIDTTKRILDNLHENDTSIYVSPLLGKALQQDIFGRKNGTSILEVINE